VTARILRNQAAAARRHDLVGLAALGHVAFHERRALFRAIDDDADGHVTWAEAQKAIAAKWPEFDNLNASRMAFDAADRDGSNKLGWKEVRLFFEFQLAFDDFWEVFQSMDTESDGLLTEKELVGKAYHLGLKPTTDPKKVFAAMRRNGGENLTTAAGEDAVNLREVVLWLGKRQYRKSADEKADVVRACEVAKQWWGFSHGELIAMDVLHDTLQSQDAWELML